MKLTDAEIAKIAPRLTPKVQCVSCLAVDWRIEATLGIVFQTTDDPTQMTTVPVVHVFCGSCGHLIPFLAKAAGVTLPDVSLAPWASHVGSA